MSILKRFLPLLAVLVLACQQAKPPGPGPTNGETSAAPQREETDPNIRFGTPGPVGKDREAYLISRPQYTLSYNGKTRNPNWVCWRLTREDIGKAKRGGFNIDPLLPQNISHVSSSVYDGAGFDRGHMCAAQDRSATQEDMDNTFMMTNVVPQAPHCNQRAWERLEHYSRELTKDGHVLWICSGPAGVGGEGKDGKKDEIGKGRIEVTVPAKVWKTILVLPRADAEPTKQSRTIAVIMPNDQSVDYDWAKYRVSVAKVEHLTGLKFWPAISEETAKVLKEKVDEVKVHEPNSK